MAITNRLRLPPGQQQYAVELERALVDELYHRGRTAVLVLLVVMGMVRFLLADVYAATPAVRVTWWTVIALILARLAIMTAMESGAGARATPSQRHKIFGVGSTLVGCGLGLLNVLAFEHLPAPQFCQLAIVQVGVSSIALVSMGASPAVYLLYMLPNLLPMAISTALGAAPAGMQLLPLMVALYIVSLVMMVTREYTTRRDGILMRLQLAELALVDSLTQLKNRRYLVEFMQAEANQALRSWQSLAPGEVDTRLCVVMVDLDHFKDVNDTHGHTAGDLVLRETADVLRDTVRRPDVVARWGGEEFVVVARGVNAAAAAGLAERIRAHVEAHEFRLPSGEVLRRTCSVGYSLFPFFSARPTLLGWEQILSLADIAMYQAKQTGRNRAIGLCQGERPWDEGHAALDAIRKDANEAVREGLIRWADAA